MAVRKPGDLIAVIIGGVLLPGSGFPAAPPSPSIRVINFGVKSDYERSKTFYVPKGGTFSLCPGLRVVTQIDARYRASGMSRTSRVTVTWTRNGTVIYRKRAAWGT